MSKIPEGPRRRKTEDEAEEPGKVLAVPKGYNIHKTRLGGA